MRASSAPKRERLEVGVTPEQKALFQHAADLEGLSLTDFIVASLQASAEETIARHARITLSSEASVVFVEALLNPPAPAPPTALAARHYRTFRETSAT